MDNCDSYIHIPSLQTNRPYLQIISIKSHRKNGNWPVKNFRCSRSDTELILKQIRVTLTNIQENSGYFFAFW